MASDRSRNDPDTRHGSVLLSGLMLTSDEGLEIFRARRAADNTLDPECLKQARDILDALTLAIRDKDPERWQRVARAWSALCSQPQWLKRPANTRQAEGPRSTAASATGTDAATTRLRAERPRAEVSDEGGAGPPSLASRPSEPPQTRLRAVVLGAPGERTSQSPFSALIAAARASATAVQAPAQAHKPADPPDSSGPTSRPTRVPGPIPPPPGITAATAPVAPDRLGPIPPPPGITAATAPVAPDRLGPIPPPPGITAATTPVAPDRLAALAAANPSLAAFAAMVMPEGPHADSTTLVAADRGSAVPVLPFVGTDRLEPERLPVPAARPRTVTEPPSSAPPYSTPWDTPVPTAVRVVPAVPPGRAALRIDQTAPNNPELTLVRGNSLGARLGGAGATEPPPSVKSPAPPALPQHLAAMDVERYAALCAQCIVSPQFVTQIHARFGIASEHERRDLDAAWLRRLHADASLAEAFEWHRTRQIDLERQRERSR